MPAGRSVELPIRQGAGSRVLHWDRTIAMFHGRDITGDLECPEPGSRACDPSFTAIAGVANFSLAGGGAFRTFQVLVFTDGSGGIAPLYIWWVDSEFACPWYGSFEDAVAANPDGSADDCFFALTTRAAVRGSAAPNRPQGATTP